MPIQIELTQGKVAIIDEADWPLVNGFRWYAVKDRNVWYAQANTSRKEGPRRTVRMHRLLLGLTDRRIYTDHINGNGLDNSRSNLRVCFSSENQRNRGAQVNNTSGYKGVSRRAYRGDWQAQIWAKGKNRHLGYFKTPEEAHQAYCRAALEMHGEFANVGDRQA